MWYFLSILFVLQCIHCSSIQILPKLTIDDYLNASSYGSVSLSPNGRQLLLHSQRPAWEHNRYENVLWLFETQTGKKKLITKQLFLGIKPKWSPSGNWFAYLTDINSKTNPPNGQTSSQDSNEKHSKTAITYLYLYNIISGDMLWIDVGMENPSAITWSKDDNSLYFVSTTTNDKQNKSDEAEWKGVIRHRQSNPKYTSTVNRIDIKRKHHKVSVTITSMINLDFLVRELLFSSSQNKLLLTSISDIIEDPNVSEVYSIDLKNRSSLQRLTDNEALDDNLQLSADGNHLFFHIFSLSPNNGRYKNTQRKLYSIDLTNGKMETWGKDFQGNIFGYAVRPQGGVYILGQLGINVYIYIQRSASKYLMLQNSWDGRYDSISTASALGSTAIAFIHSSFEKPPEVYFADHIKQLYEAKAITTENQLLSQRTLPRTKLYKWINDEDDRTIEGILHYPPGKFECKNLPLFVLIHGGPADASMNMFQGSWYSWAPLAASEGWLVLEPNYRGSTGYGDNFLNEVRPHLLSRPGRDILTGVDRLIEDGIADPTRLTLGGYSYGGVLTNWIITQTTHFNAAVSSGGPVEHVSFWGRMDVPVYIDSLIGGYPWEVSQIYYNESILYKLNNVKTPTHIVHAENDVRVPLDQSLILERGLHYLHVPVKLLILPNEGHSITVNPWHGKIKVREELKWLKKYGYVKP